MGQVCSASFGRNLNMEVRRPTRHYTSLMLVGLRISSIAFFRVSFNLALYEHEAWEFSTIDVENTFLAVKFEVVLS